MKFIRFYHIADFAAILLQALQFLFYNLKQGDLPCQCEFLNMKDVALIDKKIANFK